MNLRQAFELQQDVCLAVTGAGGKTTSLFRLARLFRPLTYVSVTTHLGKWQADYADQHIIINSPEDLSNMKNQMQNGVCLISGPLQSETGKLQGLASDQIEWLYALAKTRKAPLLIESDGARQLPLKAPADHEPAIPGFAETVLVVAGLAGLGQPLDDQHVHRAAVFSRISGLHLGSPVTEESLLRVLSSPDGGLKNIPAGARRFVLLTGAATLELRSLAERLAHDLSNVYDIVGVASGKDESDAPERQVLYTV